MLDITELENRLKKAQNRAEKAKSAHESASNEVVRLETALSVFREISGEPATNASPSGSLTRKQQIVVNSLKFGQNNAISPIDVYQVASTDQAFDGDVNYVRTTLWRMADKGSIGSANGVYWRWPDAEEVREAIVLPPQDWMDLPESDSQESQFSKPWDDDSEAPF